MTPKCANEDDLQWLASDASKALRSVIIAYGKHI